jgi:hypothetical protein
MNSQDRENLNFLLSASKETLQDWYNSVSEDDHAYAGELLAAYCEELKVRASMVSDEVESLDQAENFLKRFRLK